MGTARIKGSVVREFLLWLDKTKQLDVVRERLAALPESEREGILLDAPAFGIMANRWYPIESAHLLLDVVIEGKTELEKDRLAVDGVRETIKSSVRGIYKVVLERLISPERYAKSLPRLWGMLHDTGERAIIIERPGLAHSTIENWEGHHPFLCRLTVETMSELFRRMGCHELSCTQVSCVSWGDERCETTVRWRPSES